jgi:hypothetical protein
MVKINNGKSGKSINLFPGKIIPVLCETELNFLKK